MNDAPAKPPPRPMRLEPATNGVWSLLALGSLGHYLYLQRATSLWFPAWQTIATQTLNTPLAPFEDTNHLPQAFYRLWMD